MPNNYERSDPDTTDFGYQEVPLTEKALKVAEVFKSVASKYDLMNDLMSLGIHRWWKKLTIALSHLKPGHIVLDLAGGTGDLTKQMVNRVGRNGRVFLTDINDAMLNVGRERLINQGILNNVSYVQADAECLPFADNQFDCITIAFGLRNVTRKTVALQAMQRVLKPGGQLCILEFSTPTLPGLKPIYDAYSFNILPRLGQWVSGDAESYRYLVESIRKHPDQQTLTTLMQDAGFDHCSYLNLSGGIVALHRGYKF